MKLAVGYPWSSPFLWTGFADAMLNLERPRGVHAPLGAFVPLETRFFRGCGWCPARRHADLCEQALTWGADLICILGADQIHPPDMLLRLLARWEAGYEVVAALVPARGYVGWQDMEPFQRMAWRIRPGARLDINGLNELNALAPCVEVIDPTAGDLQEVNFIGSGVLLFGREHLLALALPWFAETYDPATMARTACMDTRFVWRLQEEAGARVWVDTTILVRHLHGFEVDESFPRRFADWKQPGAGDPAVCVFPRPAIKAA